MQKLNITKEEFMKIMSDYRTQVSKIEEFNNALDKMCSGYVVFDSENKFLDALVLTLSKLFYQTPNDYSNTIEWYLFEYSSKDNEHPMFHNGYELNINTDELFYELLCAEFEQKANGDDTKIMELFKTKGIAITEEEYYTKHNIISTLSPNAFKTASPHDLLETVKEKYVEKLKKGET